MNSYKKLFEQISPGESDDQLISRIMARKEEASPEADIMKDNDTKKTKNIFLRKAVIIPTAAALVLGATTLSVGAANNWDYNKTFKNMFARNYEGNVPVNSEVHSSPVQLPASDITSQGTTSSVEKVDYTPERPIGTFDFEKYGKPLNTVMEGDGVTATLNGMLAYNDMCYIMYTLTATDDVIAKNEGTVPGLRIDFGHWGFKIDGKIAGGMGYEGDTISEEGNTRTGYMKVEYDNVDLSGKTLNITFLTETKDGTVLLNEKKDILVDFPIAENVEKELDLMLKTDRFDGKINKVTVGGFRAMLDFEGVEKEAANVPSVNRDAIEDNVKVESIPGNSNDQGVIISKNRIADMPKTLYHELKEFGDAVLTLKDGTTVVAKLDGILKDSKDGTTTGQIVLEYTYPVNPSDVVRLTFGEYTIPISDSASDVTSQDTTSSVEKVDYTPERPIGTFDFEKYGKPLNTVMEGDGVTATLNGMLAYDDMCYIMYTLTATDEAVARCGGLVPALTIDFGNFGFKIDGKIASGMGYGTDDISEEGNTRTGFIKIEYDQVDLAGKTLNITFLAKTNSSPVLLKETKDILVDFPIAENVEKDLDLELNIDTFDGRINKVTLGGFRAYLGIEGVEKEVTKALPVNSDDAERIANRPNSLYFFDELKEYGRPVLTLKDGTTVAAGVVGLSSEGKDGTTTGQIKLEYTYPINPSDVASLTFGEYTINF